MKKSRCCCKNRDGDFDEEDVDAPGGAMDQPWLASADVDGDGKPELLLPQKNFIRAVVLEQANRRAEFNQPAGLDVSRERSNQRRGQRFAHRRRDGGANGKNATPSIFLLDAEHKQLTLCERDTNGVWQVVRNIDLPVSDFSSLQSVTLGGTKVQSIAFLGQNNAAWLPLAGDVWEFTALDGYDTPIKDGYLNDVVAGDLNQQRPQGTGVHGNGEKLSRSRHLRFKPQAGARRPLAGF